MQTLKKIISSYMRKIIIIVVIMILVVITAAEISNERRRAQENAERTFEQMEQVLAENQEELAETKKKYFQTCLHNAKAISYIIEDNPSVLEDVEELKRIAEMLEVDEIHIFDSTGCIYAGTHPEYYGYTFDSGEQMRFFKPILEDKNLTLVQEIAPNTAEGKMMQYSALWSSNGEFIIQVGMTPVCVMEATEKNELSYIFALFRVNPEVDYYAVDEESGQIVGATKQGLVGKELKQIGLDFEKVKNQKNGFFAKVGGNNSYCVFKKIGTNYIGRVITTQMLYQRIPLNMLSLTAGLVLIALVLVTAVTRYMNRYVVDRIRDINEKLALITRGNLNETVQADSSLEFLELSNYINEMVRKLEQERDFDLLTGLYNRRGLDNRLACLEAEKEDLGLCALVIIDVDGLKMINDTYGHEAGDQYLRQVAELIQEFCSPYCLAARQGGDEFILFFYRYEQERLYADLKRLEHLQDQRMTWLGKTRDIPLGYSVGYSITRDSIDYHKLFSEADERMYENKRKRKQKTDGMPG